MSWAKNFSFLIFLFVITPVLYLFLSFFNDQSENWRHLTEFLLPEMFKTTSLLVAGVVLGSTIIALPLAYIQTFWDFPGKKIFEILFLLPLAFPLYVYAAIGLTLFGLTGDVTLWLHRNLGISPFTLNIKNLLGAIQVFSFALYPYLFITLRDAFETHGAKSIEVGATLGLKKSKAIKKILFPISRPWFAAGIILIIMETLADFGASSMFNLSTFTTGIYRSWFGLFSLPTASQIASMLITLVFISYFFYKRSENRIQYAQSYRAVILKRNKVSGFKLIILYLAYSVFLFAVLFLPFYFLVNKSIEIAQNNFWEYFNSFLKAPLINTLTLSISAAFLILIVAYSLAYAKRFSIRHYHSLWYESTKLGYAIPGTILAVAIYVPLSRIDQFIFSKNVLTLTIAPLYIGYLIRFLSLGTNPLEASFKKISASQESLLKLFKIQKSEKWKRIYLPLTSRTALYAFFLIFLEVLKELPITLMTRPFGKDTLAVKIFEYTAEGDWDRAVIPSAFLVAIGAIAVILIYAKPSKNRV